MNTSLPTTSQLEKLPLRAIVAYAARAARRLSAELRGVVADDILDEAFRLIRSVYLEEEVTPNAVILGAQRVAAAIAAASNKITSKSGFHSVFSVGHAATAAMNALLAERDPTSAAYYLKRTVLAAERTLRSIEWLSSEAACNARNAAREDYDALLMEYGECEEVVIGKPVRCFGDDK